MSSAAAAHANKATAPATQRKSVLTIIIVCFVCGGWFVGMYRFIYREMLCCYERTLLLLADNDGGDDEGTERWL